MRPAAVDSEQQLRFLIDSLPGLLAYVGTDLRYRYANRAYAHWFDREPDELEGISLPVLLGERWYAEIATYVERALAGELVVYERSVVHQGITSEIRGRFVPQRGDGRLLGFLIFIEDITAQAVAERALRNNEEQFRTLLANTPDIISRFDRNLRFLYISPAVQSVLGVPQQFFIGKRHEESGVPSALSATLEQALEQVFETGKRINIAFHMPDRTGAMRHYEGLGIPERGAGDRVETVLTIVRDTTTQFETGERLRASEARFRAMVEAASEGIWMIDPEGITTFANQRMCELLGCTHQELIGRSCYEFLHPDDVERGKQGVKARIQGSIIPTEYRARQQDGTTIWIQFTAAPMRDATGRIESILGMCTDITERVERDALLRASEERYRSLVTATSSIVWTAAPDGSLTSDIGPWELYTGMDVPAGGQPWLAFVHPDDRETAEHAWKRPVEPGGIRKHTARIWNRASGQYRWCSTRAVALRDGAGGIREWIGTTTDIHDRRDAEARYSALFNASRDGVLIVNDEGNYVDVNPSFCALLKSSREDLLGRVFVPFIPEERLAEATAAFESLKREGRYSGEFPLIAADGSRLEMEWNSVANFVPGLHCCIARDITERKRFEQQFQQTQKLDGLGVLAGGIAHDFNNLLVGIMGNASLAVDALPDTSVARPMLDDVMKASDRAAQLTRQLLAYSGKARLATETIHVPHLVEELTGLLGASIPKTVHLHLQLSAEALSVEADPVQLQQVVMNLVINAAEAIPANSPGVVTVSVARRPIHTEDNHFAIVPLPQSRADFVVLTVSDTGVGMTLAVRERIFDPFFTTKFQGRGLGLSAVLGIIKSHRGGMTLRTEPGKGTTFEVLLPRVEAKQEDEQNSALPAARRHVGSILVVDDEEMVRSFLQRVLERAGFQVIASRDGREALEVLRGGDRVDAILLDLAMPEMTGDQFAPQARKLRPGIPIILSSGYPELEALSRFGHTRVNAFLQKPYPAKDLLEKLASLLPGDRNGNV